MQSLSPLSAQNNLPQALSQRDRRALLAECDTVELDYGEVLYQPNEGIDTSTHFAHCIGGGPALDEAMERAAPFIACSMRCLANL